MTEVNTAAGQMLPPTPGSVGMGNANGDGIEQDFVLFDDDNLASKAPHPFSLANQQTIAFTPSLASSTNMSQPFPTTMPTNTAESAANATNPSFTQYRNSGTSNIVGQSGSMTSGGESPFSSPASRPEDDFAHANSDLTASTSLMGPAAGTASTQNAPPSGTLSQGAPKSKRARGHGYSSSWNGGSIQQHLHQLQQNSSPTQNQAGLASSAVPMAPSSSFGGISNANSVSDWSGSDTSPRNPPSGSFGPPIHSLSLGDGPPEMGLSNEQLVSLFPAASAPANQGQAPAASTSQQANNAVIAALAASAAGSINAQLTAQQQEDRARQQIRADLMGIDSRALKGQLRDIQQGGAPSSLSGADQGAQQSNVLFPIVPGTLFGGDMAGNGQTSNGGAEQQESVSNGMMQDLTGNHSTPITTAKTQRFPAQPARQFSARTQQAVDRARAQKPTRKRMVRETSEQTISPQQAFLDYENIDAMLQAKSQAASSQPFSNGASLFSSMPATTSATLSMAGLAHANAGIDAGNSITGPSTPRAMTNMPLIASSVPHESTPSLIDGSSGSSNDSNSRAASAIPSPPQRMSLNRGDTVRPTPQQQQQQQQQQQNQKQAIPYSDVASQQSSQSSSFSHISDRGLLSPTDSTTSSTDDEDEKPYPESSAKDKRQKPPAHGVNANRSSGQQSFGQAASRTSQGAQGWGPRFSVVSSSSSESEDDGAATQQRRGNPNAMSRGAMPVSHALYANNAPGSRPVPLPVPAPAPSQQQAALGNAGHYGPANIVNLLGQGVGSMQRPMQQSWQQQQQQQQQSQQQGISFQPQGAFVTPLDTAAAQTAATLHPQASSGDAPSESGSQSQDESMRQSPAIRSSAQVINPFMGHAVPPFMPQSMPAGMAFPQAQVQMIPPQMQQNILPTGGHLPPPPQQQQHQQQHQQRNRSRTRPTDESTASGSSDDESEDWEETEDDDDDEDEDDEEGKTSKSKPKKKGRAPRRGSTTTTANRRRSQTGGTNENQSTVGATGGQTTNGHLTVCDYVGPLTHERCGTEFHRPYDLARHRETIHAREEAALLKQGKITREQCVVLYKEVDPAKSLATVEWRCNGPNGCGALFSRKDALLRHRRIRNH